MCSARRDYGKAIRHYETAIARSRFGHPEIHYHLGLAYLGRGDFAAADSSFRRVILLAPQAHWAYQKLGESLLAQHRPTEAEQVLRRGVLAAPGARWVRNALFNCMLRQGRAAEAVDELMDAAATLPAGQGLETIPFPLYLLNVNAASVTLTRAQAIRDILEHHPTAPEAWLFLSRMELLLGHPEAAASCAQRAGVSRWPSLYRRFSAAAGSGNDLKPPSFLIIGQAKAGTTALFQHLSAHPWIEPPLLKEPQFWSEHYAAGEAWYRAHFPPLPKDSNLITGEASVTYLAHPAAAQRIAAAMPDMKLILLLRDPVARAYSHYWMWVRMGLETRSWETVVDTELEAFPACPLEAVGEPMTVFFEQGAVLPHLKRWLSHFPKEQLLILRTTELARDMPGTLRRVCAFLGLPPFAPSPAKRENEGHYPPMAPEIEQRLRAWFAPHQQALEDFLTHLDEKPS
jgi:tetratricopeptide (TPR) repeat protein